MKEWALLVIVALAMAACSSSPQTVTMSVGSFKKVGNGRAELWLGIVDIAWREDLGRLVDSAEIELECRGKTYGRLVYPDKLTEPACGVQVRLVDVLDRSPPGAQFEIVWE